LAANPADAHALSFVLDLNFIHVTEKEYVEKVEEYISFECFIYLGRKIKIFSTSANHTTCLEQCLREMMLP